MGSSIARNAQLRTELAFGSIADSFCAEQNVCFRGVKRTSLIRSLMSANDPLQTFAIVCEVRRTGFRSGFPGLLAIPRT